MVFAALLAAALVPRAALGVELRTAHGPHKHEHEHHQKHDKKHGGDPSEEPPAEAKAPPAPPGPRGRAACRAPEPGDKVIYFVRHEFQRKQLGDDANLTVFGEKQARQLFLQPRMAPAFSANPALRAQLVITSPFTRTLETAHLGFSGLVGEDKILIDPNLMEYQISDNAKTEQGEAMLTRLNATSLLAQYKRLPAGWTGSAGDHVERWKVFEDMLRGRPEANVVVVSHHWMIKRAGHALNYGGVGLSAFTPKGEWRVLDDPSCWPSYKDEWQMILQRYSGHAR